MSVYAIQPSFARGELSPRLRARVDIDHYRVGLAACENFYVMRQGGLRRRPPTMYMGPTKFPNLATVIRPFVFSTEQAYALEFGHNYMRIFEADGQIYLSGAPYEIATPWPASAVAALQFTQSNDQLFVTHVDYPPQRISRRGETDWIVEEVEFKDGPYQEIVKDGTFIKANDTGNLIPAMTGPSSGGFTASASSEGTSAQTGNTSTYPAWQAFDSSPNTEWRAGTGGGGDWLQIQFDQPRIVNGYYIQASSEVERMSQSGPDLLTPGGLRAPRSWTVQGSSNGTTWTTLHTKAGVTGWGDGERRYYTFSNDEAFTYYRLDVSDVDDSSSSNPRPLSIARWALSGGGADAKTVTLTVSSLKSVNKGVGFKANDVGRHVRYLDEDAVWHWFKITSRVSANTVQATLQSPPLPSVNRSQSFRMGAFAASSGWASCVALWQERLFYAGSRDQPQTVWASKRNDFYDFGVSTPLADDDAISLTLSDVGPITWMFDGADLLIGTSSSVRPLGVSDKTQGFSAKNFSLGRPARVGAAAMAPVGCGDAILFVNRYGRSIHELVPSADTGGYEAPDLTVLSEHIFRSRVRDVAFSASPNAQLWAALGDGTLAAATYERDQKMVAFHRHTLGGGASVQSVCSTPSVVRDLTWFVSRRDGQQSILLLGPDFDDRPQADRFCLDEALSYSGAPVTTVSGLGHLAGKTVGILADGAVEVDAVVSVGGSVTLPSGSPSSVIHVGLKNRSYAETLKISLNAADGSGYGRRKRVRKVIVSFLESGSCLAAAYGAGEEVIVRDVADAMDEATPLLTADVPVNVDDSWQRGGVTSYEVTAPVPCTILAITPAYESEP